MEGRTEIWLGEGLRHMGGSDVDMSAGQTPQTSQLLASRPAPHVLADRWQRRFETPRRVVSEERSHTGIWRRAVLYRVQFSCVAFVM